MPFARCSDLDRLFACHGDAVLQGNDDTRGPGAREAAAWGTTGHTWMETGDVTPPKGYGKLGPLFKRKLTTTGIKREQWWPENALHEIAIAINPGKAYRAFGGPAATAAVKEAWKADFDDEWVTGTADARWWMFDQLYVDDLKTGREVTWEQYQWQVHAYCLGIARCSDYRGDVHATLTHWPRYPVASVPRRFGKVITASELDAFEQRLIRLRSDILRSRESRARLVLTAGEHCTWCKSKKICPEFDTGQGTARNEHGS